MDPDIGWVIPLTQAVGSDEKLIGGKAARLAELGRAGFRVPRGFCVTTLAYEHLLEETKLANVIRVELGRKPLDSMRWEEIWDVALRIRSAFMSAVIPDSLSRAVASAVEELGRCTALAVRSSAPGEDSASRSFAGLHESVLGVVGHDAVLDALRVVWASLWSDAALLYRRELALNPARSRMAVLVQELVDERPSGVSFGRDPRDFQAEQAIVEAIPGLCGDLVDGVVDPDRWVLRRPSGDVLDWRPGDRENDQGSTPVLTSDDLARLFQTLLRVEALFGWPPDIEWTGRRENLTLLQARPITTTPSDPHDTRGWYLSLRPGPRRLNALARRVAEELIPQLEEEGERLAAEELEGYSDPELATAIQERFATLDKWRRIYWNEFIPFAHGVRQLGTYYNDAVRPEDPYEFVGLLRGEQMVAIKRNRAIMDLARRVSENQSLRNAIRQVVAGRDHKNAGWETALAPLSRLSGGTRFLQEFQGLLADFMDVAYGDERLADHPDLLLETVIELAYSPDRLNIHVSSPDAPQLSVRELEQRLFYAVGKDRYEEARHVLAIGRLSWRLRDDDNLLVGRLESQLLRALNLGAERLRMAGRLGERVKVGIAASAAIVEALCDPWVGPITLPSENEGPSQSIHINERPRQLVGQPASPGLATGRARKVRGSEDLGGFRVGEILVCDAIQPTMTHLVPLASAVVERRGGMLIHGAIIARELGIPCVNGIAGALDLVEDGELITVDGYVGIVTVGLPEFDLEYP